MVVAEEAEEYDDVCNRLVVAVKGRAHKTMMVVGSQGQGMDDKREVQVNILCPSLVVAVVSEVGCGSRDLFEGISAIS